MESTNRNLYGRAGCCSAPAPRPLGQAPIQLDSLPTHNSNGSANAMNYGEIVRDNRNDLFRPGEPCQTDSYAPFENQMPLTRVYADGPPAPAYSSSYDYQPPRSATRAGEYLSSVGCAVTSEACLDAANRRRPEYTSTREPWQRAASLSRIRPPGKLSGVVIEKHPSDGRTVYLKAPASAEIGPWPDCCSRPTDLGSLWPNLRRQPFDIPKPLYEKHTADRYPAVYKQRLPEHTICPDPSIPLRVGSLKPFPFHQYPGWERPTCAWNV